MAGILLSTGSISCAASQKEESTVDWPNFLARQDLVWDRLPTDWSEGAFLGNGQEGAMITKGPEGSLKWHIGRSDVVLRGNRIPIGDFLIHPVGHIQSFAMRLHLWDAEATGVLKTDQGRIEFSSLTHAGQPVQLIEIHATGGETNLAYSWSPGLAVNPRLLWGKNPPIIPDKEKSPDPFQTQENGVQLCVQPLPPNGAHVTAWQAIAEPEDRTLILLSVGYSPTDPTQAKQEAIASLALAEKTGWEALISSHRKWWHDYYPESFLSIPDARLESFYWIQMYKMASATRADRPALDLMGPWFNSTRWAAIWWNLNIQLAYSPQFTANRLDLGESLFRMLDQNTAQLAKNAKGYGADSEAIGRVSSYNCAAGVGPEICDLPYALHNYYLQCRYTMDDTMLRERFLPRLERSMNYYLHLLQADSTGKLHLTQGLSPEYPDQPLPNPDCNVDLSLLRWGCQTLLDICARLKIDDPLIPKWKETLQDLIAYPQDETGFRISTSVPFAQSHRHYSHLFMIYPLCLMDPEIPADRAQIVQSFDTWRKLPDRWAGFSYTGAASISAMLGDGDGAAGYLNELLNTKILPNTMYTEGSPCIETPLSAATSLEEMLIASYGNKIRVFPAIPSAWRDVSFYHLRTEGAFLLSAARRNGKTDFIRIDSLAGEPCRIWTDIASPVTDPPVGMKDLGAGTYELSLAKGQSVVVHSKNSSPNLTIAPVESTVGRTNSFGATAQ